MSKEFLAAKKPAAKAVPKVHPDEAAFVKWWKDNQPDPTRNSYSLMQDAWNGALAYVKENRTSN